MRRRGDHLLAVALALPTGAAAFGFCRLFEGWSFLPALLLAAALGHLGAVLTRRWRGVIADLAHLVLGVAVATWTLYPQTTTFGLATSRTLDLARSDLSHAWSQFSAESAPTPARTGYLLLGFAAVWLAAWAADRLVFRYRTPAEALLPSATLFVFVTLLSAPRHRLVSTLVFGGAVGVFALTHRAVTHPTGRRALLGAGVLTLGTALGLSTLLVTTVPGAQGAGAVAVRDLGHQSTSRTVVSPLVDIRRRLLDQSNAQLLQVTASSPSYWRLMALDDFDGTVWSSSQKFEDAKGHLASNLPRGDRVRTVRQEFRIGPLDQPWVPAAFEARAVLEGGADLLWDPRSSTLIVDRSRKSAANLDYVVESRIPDATPDELRRSTGSIPSDVRRRDVALPESFPDEAARIAAAVTRGATNDYDRARRLQDWFRGNFRYSTEVGPGQSSQAILEFLHSRVGYCEQFAGSFAAMARSLGIPARVVVGFTPGTPSPDRPDTYTVYGRNAHAWPEVYLAGAGWVSFEPTPGRGDPQATRHTGVAPQQAGPDQTPQPAPTVPATTAVPVPGSSVPGPPSSVAAAPPAASTPTSLPPSSGGADRSWVLMPLVAAAVVAALLAGSAVVVRARHQRRHRRASTPGERVMAAWGDVLEVAAGSGIAPRATETHRELVRRIVATAELPDDDDSGRLGALVTTAAWSPGSIDDDTAREAQRRTDALVAQLSARLSRGARLAARFDPRSPQRRVRGGERQSSRWSRSRMRAWPLVR